jgi:hypothetical protein
MPQEASGELPESVLPPGQRDRNGFWLPTGYDDPRSLVRRRRRRVGERRLVGADEQEPVTA